MSLPWRSKNYRILLQFESSAFARQAFQVLPRKLKITPIRVGNASINSVKESVAFWLIPQANIFFVLDRIWILNNLVNRFIFFGF